MISHGLQIGKDQKGDNQQDETVLNLTRVHRRYLNLC